MGDIKRTELWESERAVFIVDEQGDVMWKWVGENPGVQPNYDEVIAASQV